MSTHKHFDRICCVVLAVTLVLTVLFMNAESLGVQKASAVMGYEGKLFDTSAVHTIDIIMDDWDEFISNCKNEEYYACTVVIDSDAFKNVAIRGKGNTSLMQVESYGNNRYSFKIEFDHFDSAITYYGLDKLCLNNIIQDNTYMKDYLCYRMIDDMGVASPLCSYVYITVNGEDWGLYLAVEGVEESFLQRNYGNDYGNLYKPDSQSMGGGRGNGKGFDMDNFLNEADSDNTDGSSAESMPMQMPDINNGDMQQGSRPDAQMPGGMTPPGKNSGDSFADNSDNTFGRGGMTNGSDDVLLEYIDDEFDSYSNIFDNAKTDISDGDKTRLIEALKKLSNGEELYDTVDIEAVIQYFVVHNFVLNFDSYTGSMIHNYYLYEKDGQMQMIPWDYNLAFGGFESAVGAENLVNYPIDSPVSGGNVEDRPMIAWIFADEEYTSLYHQYFSEFISQYFDSGYFEEMIDNVSEMISGYIEKDPTKFCTYEEYETGISTLKKFCILRAESISGQLEGTIGSTWDTQESSTLIDAGDIQISDMGLMNNSMGQGMKMPGENMQIPDTEINGEVASEALNDSAQADGDETDSSDSLSGQMQVPSEITDENGTNGNGIPQTPGNSGGQMQVPSEITDENSTNGNGIPQMPGNSGGSMQNPDKTEQTLQPENSADSAFSSLIYLVISAGVLAAGILFALIYKRRR